MKPKYLAVKNFTNYQHYRDRRPAWIKFYVSFLDDEELNGLPIGTRLVSVLILLVAAEKRNQIPNNHKWLAIELSIPDGTAKRAIDDLLRIGFLVPYSAEHDPEVNWASRYVSEETRAFVMDRDGHACVNCGSSVNLEIDHIVPISKGGNGEVHNLQVLCRSCNRSKRAGQLRSADAPQMPSNGSGQIRSLEKEVEKEKPLRVRKPDPIWDALVKELGNSPATSSERGRWNRAIKEMREAGASSEDEVRARCREYRRKYPNVTLTPTALASHWGALTPASWGVDRKPPPPPCPECGVGGGLHSADCPTVNGKEPS